MLEKKSSLSTRQQSKLYLPTVKVLKIVPYKEQVTKKNESLLIQNAKPFQDLCKKH